MLVGYNQLTSPTPYTLYYYLPELVMGFEGKMINEEETSVKIRDKTRVLIASQSSFSMINLAVVAAP